MYLVLDRVGTAAVPAMVRLVLSLLTAGTLFGVALAGPEGCQLHGMAYSQEGQRRGWLVGCGWGWVLLIGLLRTGMLATKLTDKTSTPEVIGITMFVMNPI